MYDYYVPDLTRAIRERNKIEEEKVISSWNYWSFNGKYVSWMFI